MQIQLKVSHHSSGRYTLMQRNQNDIDFSDVAGTRAVWQ